MPLCSKRLASRSPRSTCLPRSPGPARRASPARSIRGFTLIDLLVAVACLAVLMSIALPSYQEQVARSRRNGVQATLLEDAGYMERYIDANGAFTGLPPPALPLASSPRTGPADYVITVSVPADTPTSFVLTATRAGAMAGDRCGDFTYDHLGRRALAPGSFAAGQSVATCWR